MAASEVAICNQSLTWLAANTIISLDDPTVEAGLCKANYALLRDAVLNERAWTFATKRFTLTPLSEEPEYGYSKQFLIPSNVLTIIECRWDNAQGGTPTLRDDRANGANTLGWRREEDKILANVDVIYMKAIVQIIDTQKFSPVFTQTLATRLARDICIPLTESNKRYEQMAQMYLMAMRDAAAIDGMQGTNDMYDASQLIRVR